MQVEEVMTREVVSVGPEATYKELVETMVAHGVSGVPVVDDHGALVGVVTEADLLSRSGYGSTSSRALAVLADVASARQHHWASKAHAWTARDLMSRSVVSCSPRTDVKRAARTMLDHDVTRLPVVDDGHVVGVLARQDVLRALVRPDAEIEAQIRRVLATDPNRPDDHHVVVSVEGGRVVLDGDVRYPHDVPVVVDMASRVEGVVGVEHHLHAREERPTTPIPGPWSTHLR